MRPLTSTSRKCGIGRAETKPGVVLAKGCEFLVFLGGGVWGRGSGGWWGVVPVEHGVGGVGTGKGTGKIMRVHVFVKIIL